MKHQLPTLKYELELWDKKHLVIGIDEVGRGALSGPIYVSGVCLKPVVNKAALKKIYQLGIDDSKKLTVEKRQRLIPFIRKISLVIETASVSNKIINKIGITKAIYQAGNQVIRRIRQAVGDCHLLLDGGMTFGNQKGIVHGDGISLSIAAASIIAKVERDNLMKKLAKKYPHYGWERNKGYGTRMHIRALKKHGKTSLHRDLFIRRTISDSFDDKNSDCNRD